MDSRARRRRRIGIVALAVTLILFVIELVALSLGQVEIALACFAAFVIGWFVLRSWMKSAERRFRDSYRHTDESV